MKKYVLVNAYFKENLGDDLFLKVLFDRYSETDIEFHLLTTNKNYKAIFKKYTNVKIIPSLNIKFRDFTYNLFYKLNEYFLNYKKYYAYIYIGGSIFMEDNSWENTLKNISYLPNRFKGLRKKTYIIGANFGPFKSEAFIEKHQEYFSHFDDICFRDNDSYRLFQEFNNIRVAPDVVFSLDEEPDIKKNIIGFSLIDIEKRKDLNQYYYNYCDKVNELIRKSIDDGSEVHMFSFCEKEGDMNAINHILTNLSNEYKKYITVINYTGDIATFLKQFKVCKVIFGTRFHSVILGLLFNQPIFPIIYSEKTYNVLKDLNLHHNCCFIKNIENLKYEDVLEGSQKNKMNREELAILKMQAKRQFKELDKGLIF